MTAQFDAPSMDDAVQPPSYLLSVDLSSASKFVRSRAMDQLLAWDEEHRACDGTRVDVAILSRWPEVGRSLRAFQLVERELRRCAAAWATAHVVEDDVWLLPESSPRKRFQDHLLEMPRPIPEPAGGFVVVATNPAPFGVLLQPRGDAVDLLTVWPAAAVGFAMAHFGSRFSMSLHADCRLESVTYADPTGALLAMMDVACGRWRGSCAGRQQSLDVQGLFRLLRAIAPSRDFDGGSAYGVDVVVLCTSGNGRQDAVASRLH